MQCEGACLDHRRERRFRYANGLLAACFARSSDDALHHRNALLGERRACGIDQRVLARTRRSHHIDQAA